MSVILNWLVDFVFPKFCVVCDQEGDFLCRKCKKSLPSALQICPMCTGQSIFGQTHESCRTQLGLDGLTAVFDYKDKNVKKLVESIKFGFNRDLINLMLRGWRWPRNVEKTDLIFVPVPLHRYRENWRGFNQAELLARRFAGRGEVLSALRRVRATKQQAMVKNRRERTKNLIDCFEINFDTKEELRGKNVILVDDVFTSGATMRECAKTLKQNGIKMVWGLVLAR